MVILNRRVLCIDPGQKRIGIASSDETGTIATPYRIINHLSKSKDAEAIIEIAQEIGAGQIVIGIAIGLESEKTLSARRAANLAHEISSHTNIPVSLWDESESTNEAFLTISKSGKNRKKKGRRIDDLAATIVLQSFLENMKSRLE